MTGCADLSRVSYLANNSSMVPLRRWSQGGGRLEEREDSGTKSDMWVE
jgi:hypothetical protein